MTDRPHEDVPTIDHAGHLEDLTETPAFLVPGHTHGTRLAAAYSCAYCGVGDSGAVEHRRRPGLAPTDALPQGTARLVIQGLGRKLELTALVAADGSLQVSAHLPLTEPRGIMVGELDTGGPARLVILREITRRPGESGGVTHIFAAPAAAMKVTDFLVVEPKPTTGCVKLRTSLGHQPTVFPVHLAPSVPRAGGRKPVAYGDAIAKLAELLLAHRPPRGRTLVYACGQVDYFTIFAFQEVFRLLGVRNLAGNAEHCLNAGAVHNEMLTGQEGPFLTLDQAMEGPGRVYLLNGWNGLISHPPAFLKLMKRADLDAWLVEVAVTESAQTLAARVGPERVLLIKPGSDPHLALAVAHELFRMNGVDAGFIERFADAETFARYRAVAERPEFAAAATAARIAAEPKYVERLEKGIHALAAAFARPGTVPINLPSVGLSQTKGAVTHCLWGNALAAAGKYGLRADGSPAGGTLRLPGQINAETEVQGLSRNKFFGRIPVDAAGAVEAARRMGLPDGAYAALPEAQPIAALDYGDPRPEAELVLCFGTQFESNMPGRRRWIEKLTAAGTTLVVVDPIPDPFTLKHAALVIPSPPHGASAKLYQNGEWRLSLSVPRKRRGRATRTDATIVYDAMAEVARQLGHDPGLRDAHPDLAAHLASGYLARRFMPVAEGGGLTRIDGEVSRPELWQRVLDYLDGGAGRTGPLYCRPVHADGRPIGWDELLQAGSLIYGGVGTHRYRLDGDAPYRDIYGRPRRFTFFTPSDADLAMPAGILLNSGRGTLSDDKARVRFATATFNSGKATPGVDMPEENPLYVSPALAARLGLANGDRARVTGVASGGAIEVPVVVSERVKGDSVYINFHKTRAELEKGRYLNDVTSHAGRCPYTSQSNFKVTEVRVERLP